MAVPEELMISRMARAMDAEFERLALDASAQDISRAVLREMREPTHAMMSASGLGLGSAGVWRAMIDAELADDAPEQD